MNGKIKLILTVVTLAVLVGGASVLYNVLLEDADGTSQLVIYNNGTIVPSADGDSESENSVPNDSALAVPEAEVTVPTPDSSNDESEESEDAVTTDKEPGESEDATAPDTSGEGEDVSEPEENITRVPDFLVYTKDGEAKRLSDYFGKPIVLNFWASWCNPCRREMPRFEEAYNEYGSEVEFVMVNLTSGSRESFDAASSFIEDSGYTFPVLYDTAGYAASAYRVYSIPTTYFINSDGVLVASVSGAISESALDGGIELIK